MLQQLEILTFQQWGDGFNIKSFKNCRSILSAMLLFWLVSRWSYLPNLLHYCTYCTYCTLCTYCIYVPTYLDWIAWHATTWYCIAVAWHDSTLQCNDGTWHEMIRSILDWYCIYNKYVHTCKSTHTMYFAEDTLQCCTVVHITALNYIALPSFRPCSYLYYRPHVTRLLAVSRF